jgi:hypothetical protein
MTPIEVAAKAYIVNGLGQHYWATMDDPIREVCKSDMRAALLALAECEFPDIMEFKDGKNTAILHPNNGASKDLFRKFCRAIASQEAGDG